MLNYIMKKIRDIPKQGGKNNKNVECVEFQKITRNPGVPALTDHLHNEQQTRDFRLVAPAVLLIHYFALEI